MLALGLLAAALSAGADPGADASRLAVIRQAPDFALTDQDGKILRRRDLRGKVVVVGFVFTTCTGTCPATTLRMSRLEEKLDKQGLFKGGRVRLVSITLDPARDTPAVLRRYMRLHRASPGHWSFLTGERARVEKVMASWGMWARPAANGQLDHPSRVYLVDPRGRVREIYSLEFFQPAWVLEDVRLLLREADGEEAGKAR